MSSSIITTRDGTQVYPGLSHGMVTTHPYMVNRDLFGFIKSGPEMIRRLILAIALGATLMAQPSVAAERKATGARNVVLVHGAWADGSSWGKVIPLLQKAGLNVVAVQNPLTSLADSTAATKRVLAQQDGPTVLVAHSWGGTVISDVGTDPKVTSLVYVAARAPDANEDFVALSARYPAGPVRVGVEEH